MVALVFALEVNQASPVQTHWGDERDDSAFWLITPPPVLRQSSDAKDRELTTPLDAAQTGAARSRSNMVNRIHNSTGLHSASRQVISCALLWVMVAGGNAMVMGGQSTAGTGKGASNQFDSLVIANRDDHQRVGSDRRQVLTGSDDDNPDQGFDWAIAAAPALLPAAPSHAVSLLPGDTANTPLALRSRNHDPRAPPLT